MEKKAIVTGANGFIGRYLVKELIKSNYEVFAVVRGKNTSSIQDTGANIINCDLDEIEHLADLIGRQKDSIFYNMAWEGNSGEKRKDYELQLKNAKRTVDAAKVASKIGCRKFIMAGSVTQLLYRDYLRRDNISPEMVTCYAIGKMTAESLLKCISTDLKMNYCWCYISNFYGEDDPTKNFINFLIDSYQKGETPILTPANQLADFMHVSDVAKALVSLERVPNTNESLYIGYGAPKPLRYFIEVIHNMIAPNMPSGIGLKSFEGMSIDYNSIDYKKLNRLTGFVPSIAFDVGIETVIKSRVTIK